MTIRPRAGVWIAMAWAGVTLSLAGACVMAAEAADRPPALPVGTDAYLMWDRWPRQRLGVRAYMRSTYDRQGGNGRADASNFLYQLADDFNVTLDVEGRGALYFARYNHWHGSPWHYEVDGEDHVIDETGPRSPRRASPQGHFIPAAAFPAPLAWTYTDTHGANLSWIPVAFQQRFRMAYAHTFYGTGYYIYHLYADDAELSRPLRTWRGQPPDPAVLALLKRSGQDIAPPAGGAVWQRRGKLNLPPRDRILFASLDTGATMVRALKLSVPRDQAQALERCRLRVTWDDRQAPSIDAPVALFFGTGSLYNRDDREYLVQSLPMTVRFDKDRAHLACYFPMPFFRSARFELVGDDQTQVSDLTWELRGEPYAGPPNHVGYFHATYTDHPDPRQGFDMVWLDTDRVEGGGPWSGSFVGTSFIFTDRAYLPTLEGDPRFFFDDSLTPQAQGTGTEEWGGGGDYWGGQTMSLPLAGHPVGAPSVQQAHHPRDQIHSAYRFLLADLFPFGRRALIRFEHGALNTTGEHYQAVAYWYGLPAASLVLTDQLNVGDPESEQAHAYHNPKASPPYILRSRYEWGPGFAFPAHLTGGPGQDPVPVMRKVGRTTDGASEFTVRLVPDNHGVLLRRTLDYAFANQRAEVYVAEAEAESPQAYEFAGVWYLAGSNTYYHSFPQAELDPSEPRVLVSDRRLRDDEFIIPQRLTRGRRSIRLRIVLTPVRTPLLPGRPVQHPAWSEIAYNVYCWTMPAFWGPEPATADK